MKVIVIGLGSMGKRRIRLIKQINEEIEIIGVDFNIERCKETEDRFQIKTSQDMNKVEGVDCAFICTSPLSHSKIINACLVKGWHVFTELNLISDMYNENIKLANKKNLTLFLSSTFLYRDEVKYIKNKIETVKCKLNYTYHVGQYLPDWHPWEHYKDYFVGDKRTNGCREIMTIEFPWLISLFGNVINFTAIPRKMTKLELDYPDSFSIQVIHSSGSIGMISIDVVSRKPVRNMEIYGEDLYLSWDGSPTGLSDYNFHEKKDKNISLYPLIDTQVGYSSFVVENAYRAEIEDFFDTVKTESKAVYTFKQDKEILQLIDKIEASSY